MLGLQKGWVACSGVRAANAIAPRRRVPSMPREPDLGRGKKTLIIIECSLDFPARKGTISRKAQNSAVRVIALPSTTGFPRRAPESFWFYIHTSTVHGKKHSNFSQKGNPPGSAAGFYPHLTPSLLKAPVGARDTPRGRSASFEAEVSG